MIWSANAFTGMFALANKSGKMNVSICLPCRDIPEEAAACCSVSLFCFGFNQLGFLFNHAAGQKGSISVVKILLFSQKINVSVPPWNCKVYSAALFTVGWTVKGNGRKAVVFTSLLNSTCRSIVWDHSDFYCLTLSESARTPFMKSKFPRNNKHQWPVWQVIHTWKSNFQRQFT